MSTPINDTIYIEHEFNASADKVWNAWTDPFLVSKWFGSEPNNQVLSAVMDVQPGGRFEITFKDSNGTEHTCSGMYKDVQPYSWLSFTWMWKSEPGVESFVTVLFQPNNNTTLMQFEHAHVGYASAHNYEKGWEDTFLKLDKVFTT